MKQFIRISKSEESLFSETDVFIYFQIYICNRNYLFEHVTDIGNFDFNN